MRRRRKTLQPRENLQGREPGNWTPASLIKAALQQQTRVAASQREGEDEMRERRGLGVVAALCSPPESRKSARNVEQVSLDATVLFPPLHTPLARLLVVPRLLAPHRLDSSNCSPQRWPRGTQGRFRALPRARRSGAHLVRSLVVLTSPTDLNFGHNCRDAKGLALELKNLVKRREPWDRDLDFQRESCVSASSGHARTCLY